MGGERKGREGSGGEGGGGGEERGKGGQKGGEREGKRKGGSERGGEGKGGEERGREERGVVGREEEGEGKGGREGRREERGRERGREEVRGEGRGREGRGERGKRREWIRGMNVCMGEERERKTEMSILQVKSCRYSTVYVLYSVSTHIPSPSKLVPALANFTCLYRCFVESMFASSLAGFSASSGQQQECTN